MLKAYESMSLIVRIEHVYESILSDIKSICRYKDYILKLLIKEVLKACIRSDKISSMKSVRIYINIDEQLRSTNGIYNLEDTIYEELKHGIVNYNYGKVHEPIFYGDVDDFK